MKDISKMSSFANTVWVSVKVKDESMPSEAELKEMTKQILDEKISIQWGDFVANKQSWGGRNDGLTMWNGKQVIDLETEPDDYGTLPEIFEVLIPHPETGELIPPNYWHNYLGEKKIDLKKLENHLEILREGVSLEKFEPYDRFISHNGYVNFDYFPYRMNLMRNVTYGKVPFDSEHYGVWTSSTLKNGRTFYIVLDIMLIQEDVNIMSDQETYELVNPEKYVNVLKTLLKASGVDFSVYPWDDSYTYNSDTYVLFASESNCR